VTTPLLVPELVLRDQEILERRARELAAGTAAEEVSRVQDRLVSFTLGGAACAVDAGVLERAVARLTRPLPVPRESGDDRLVAFVDERPVPVVDLEAFAAGRPRAVEELEAHPALIVTTTAGPVAVAVEGPLELLEDHVAFAAEPGDPAPIRAAGRLRSGILALDPAWLQEWAERAALS
jgi:hypothetical protein